MRTEQPHNTPEQVEGYLADALALVAKLDPPADLRAVCFNLAVTLGSSKQILVEQFQAPVLDGRIGRI